VDIANIREMRHAYKFWLENLKDTGHLGEIGIAVRTILN
jgi:hypothetical protein